MEKSVFVRKQEVRSRYLERRNELSLEERRQKSGKIKEFLMREPVFRRPGRFLSTWITAVR